MVRILIDNDVIIKIAAYSLGSEFVNKASVDDVPPALLSVGRFVARDRLTRSRRFKDGAAALKRFEAILPSLLLVEPTEAELVSAAELEAVAITSNVELDSGESQLLAILLTRAAKLLVTGDKRAIRAIATIANTEVVGRVACLEQLVVSIVDLAGVDRVRELVCREPDADRAISICLHCTSGSPASQAEVMAALRSYVDHLRNDTAAVLLSGISLSSLAA